MFTSTPVVPVIPSTPGYGIGALATLRQFTREAYFAAAGEQAPDNIPELETKLWLDTSATGDGDYTYQTYEVVNGKLEYITKTIPRSVARSVNLPGLRSFAPWIPAPTPALRTGPGNLSPQTLNPDYLSRMADAITLEQEIGGSELRQEPPMGGGFGTSFPETESRRLWEVLFNGRWVNAGLLLKNKYAKGIGAPGKWNLTGVEEPVWIPQQRAAGPENPKYVPTPMRQLDSSETATMTLMGAATITHGDMPVSPESATLARIERHCERIEAGMQKSGLL